MKKSYAKLEVAKVLDDNKSRVVADPITHDQTFYTHLVNNSFDDLETIFKLYLAAEGCMTIENDEYHRLVDIEREYGDANTKLSVRIEDADEANVALCVENGRLNSLVEDLQVANASINTFFKGHEKKIEELKNVVVKLAGKL